MNVHCRWCGTARGVIWLGEEQAWGFLICPRCDYAHTHGDHGPPTPGHKIKDVPR